MDKQRINAIIDNMTLFDDDLMSRVFDHNTEAANDLLRAILGRDIQVNSCIGQMHLKSPRVDGHSVTLDILATDVDGRQFNVEVQNSSSGADVHRARYHSCMLDSRILDSGSDYTEMKDSYVIFIYNGDKYHKGLPLYHAVRTIKETGHDFGDGSHIIYVNGKYTGDDAIGQLMKDFHCKNANDIQNKNLAKAVHHQKETKEERDSMCKAVEDFAKEYAEEVQAIADAEKKRADALEAELEKYKALLNEQNKNEDKA